MSNIDTAIAVVDLTTVKEALEISGGTYDAILNGMINRASGIIERYTGRGWVSAARTEVYQGNDTYKITLRAWPVSAITSVSYASNSDFSNPTWQALNARDYTLQSVAASDAGILFLNSGFPRGVNNFQVVYTGGYTLATMPYPIQEAAIQIVNFLFRNRKATPGMRSETLGKYSYTREPAGDRGIVAGAGVKDILDLYRTIPV